MTIKNIFCIPVFFISLLCQPAVAQQYQANMHYTVSMPQPGLHYFEVTLRYNTQADSVLFKMPAWSPGGYFLVNFAGQLEQFSAEDAAGNKLPWHRSGNNSWTVMPGGKQDFIIHYRINCVRPGIDQSWVQDEWALVGPTGMFLYTDTDLEHPVTVNVIPQATWKAPPATGLQAVPGKPNTFFADNFDVLYDCPILMGNLETLDTMYIQNVPHYFTAYDIGNIIDRKQFTANLQKITSAGINIIGDIPYKNYTYLSIGYGPGGLEHLNSTVVSFRSKDFLSSPEKRFRNYRLLAHEYFHHYNVKRIRPLELGPFDYSGPNYTKLLWFAEGVTEYYAHLLTLRAGLASFDEVARSFQNIIRNYENKQGHLHQSLTQASWSVWNNSPFSKTKKQADSSISYYEKGCIAGFLIDLDIRHRSNNKYSLDDVMRFLYKKYYRQLGRGFTDAELQTACESFAGGSMNEVFSYVNSTAAVNYTKYLGYAGLQIDTAISTVAYAGFTTGVQFRNYMVINSVEENAAAWQAGLHTGDTIMSMQGKEPCIEILNELLLTKKPGEEMLLGIKSGESIKTVAIKLGARREKRFTIKELAGKNKLQQDILRSWKTNKIF